MRLRVALPAVLACGLLPVPAMAHLSPPGRESRTSPVAEASLARVRALTPLARDLLRDGLAHSPTFGALVGELASTDLIVLIHTGRWTPEEGPCHASVRLLTARRGVRFVRVWVDAWWRSRPDQLLLLAHELQHVVELAREPGVRDPAAMASLFRRIGSEGGDGCFETDAARRVEVTVAAELVKAGQW